MNDREKEIIVLLTRGYSDADIALTLGLPKQRVKHLLTDIYRRHGLMNVSRKRIALAVASVEHGTSDISVPSLSQREKEVIQYVVDAYSCRKIAGFMNTTEQYVKNMLMGIYSKTGCGSQLELALWQCRLGIRREVEPELIGIS
jgi:DNA-binding CsgD family transcriptional regulator